MAQTSCHRFRMHGVLRSVHGGPDGDQKVSCSMFYALKPMMRVVVTSHAENRLSRHQRRKPQPTPSLMPLLRSDCIVCSMIARLILCRHLLTSTYLRFSLDQTILLCGEADPNNTRGAQFDIGFLLCSPCVPDIHRLVHIPCQCSCTLLSAPLLMQAWHSLHITIKAQTQKHTFHWTHLLRAFPYHGSGAFAVLLRSKTGAGISPKGTRE